MTYRRFCWRCVKPTDGQARSACGRSSQRTYRGSDTRAGQGASDRIRLAAKAVAGAECDGSVMERAETRCGRKPAGCLNRQPRWARLPMGAQPDTLTSTREVWHGVPQILAQVSVAAHLATYLDEEARAAHRQSASPPRGLPTILSH